MRSLNFESFSKAKYKEQTEYPCSTVVEFHIFSVKSILLAVSRPFQTSDCTQNIFKFCHSFVWYWCYMLTLQALMYTENPNMNWRAHLEQCHRNPDTIKQPRVMLNHSCDPHHIQGSVHLCKLKNNQNSAELPPLREILPSIKTNYHMLMYLQLHYWMTLTFC